MTGVNDEFKVMYLCIIEEKVDSIRLLNNLVTEKVRLRDATKDPVAIFELNHDIGFLAGYMKLLREQINFNRGILDEHAKRKSGGV